MRGARPGFVSLAAVVRGRGARGETKAVDLPASGATLTTAIASAGSNPTSKSFTLIQEGAGFWNRIGRKVAMQSLQITGQIAPTTGVSALSEETLRIIIFYDKQPNGVAATWNQVVQAYDNAGTATNLIYDGVNLDNRDRFVILRDRKIVMPQTSAAGIATGPPYGASIGTVGAKDGSDGGSVWKEFIKLGNMEAQFNGTANPATVAQVATGNLGIVFAGGVGGQYTIVASARLRFQDF